MYEYINQEKLEKMNREKWDRLYPPRTRAQVTTKQILSGEWFHSLDGKWRKRMPDCPDGKHEISPYGFCQNCDYALRPAEETATGR